LCRSGKAVFLPPDDRIWSIYVCRAPFPYLSEKGADTILSVHVQPRAAKSGFAGIIRERLKIRVNSPPAEGEANRECIDFLSKMLGIAKSDIKLLRGAHSRDKTFIISRQVEFIREKLAQTGLGCDE
jgi:hypothetical protein